MGHGHGRESAGDETKRGTSMGFLVLDDRTARLEVSLFSEAFEQYGGKVSKDELLVVEGEVQHDEYNAAQRFAPVGS